MIFRLVSVPLGIMVWLFGAGWLSWAIEAHATTEGARISLVPLLLPLLIALTGAALVMYPPFLLVRYLVRTPIVATKREVVFGLTIWLLSTVFVYELARRYEG